MQKLRNLLPVLVIVVIGAVGFLQHRSSNSVTPRTVFAERQLNPEDLYWTVVSVQDGDTLTAIRGSEEKQVRLICTNSPELDQPLGKESREYLQNFIAQHNNRVMMHIVGKDQDGLNTAEVYTTGDEENENSLNGEQLLAGLAYVYEPDLNKCPNAIAFQYAEEIAQEKQVGVWEKGKSYQKPWDYRQQKRSR